MVIIYPGVCSNIFCSKQLKKHKSYEYKGQFFCSDDCINDYKELNKKLANASDPHRDHRHKKHPR